MDANLQAGFRLVGANLRGDRQRDDFYATPAPATLSLLEVEYFEGGIYEPCCGQGHMSKVLEQAGYEVESTDLVDRGYGKTGIDFLMEIAKRDNVVTNPPYGNLALPMARHCQQIARNKTALLLKLNFLAGQARRKFFDEHPPARVWVFSRRVNLMKDGIQYKNGGMMDLAWYVWETGYKGPTTVGWI
jgi:hypothetical protein